jgi:hypothetical protein
MSGDPLTWKYNEAIANTLAWSYGGSLDEGIMIEYGFDFESLQRVMARDDYEWDFSGEQWISTREIWADWDGKLPSQAK